jgi:hypothetical protein
MASSSPARERFLDAVLDYYIPAVQLLERCARSDYSADELQKEFPEFASCTLVRDDEPTPSELFEA